MEFPWIYQLMGNLLWSECISNSLILINYIVGLWAKHIQKTSSSSSIPVAKHQANNYQVAV
ncbi:hypothetical protein WICANDRAFT_90912, partial [Wickerhamomyces anomalus NRRL Y-366-8]